MNTFVLSPLTANLSVQDLITRAANGSIEVLDVNGNVIAYLLSPVDHEVLTYAEAKIDMEQHRETIDAAASRRGGVTTAELLEHAISASKNSSQT